MIKQIVSDWVKDTATGIIAVMDLTAVGQDVFPEHEQER